eukprot:13573605-Alexandrium_andersonii.AAC.1
MRYEGKLDCKQYVKFIKEVLRPAMDAVDQAPVPMVTRSGQGRGVKKTRKGKTYTHDQDSSRLPPATDKALIE